MRVRSYRGIERLLLLEIGSRSLRAVALVADDSRGRRICGISTGGTCAGRDGSWRDPASARSEIAAVCGEASRQAGLPFRQVLLSLGGTHVTLLRSQGRLVLELPLTLRADHLESALEAASHLGLPPDREVLHVLPLDYAVDGTHVRRSPLGLRARGLVANCAVLTVSRAVLDGIERALGAQDREIVDAVAEPLVTARAVVGDEERLRGIVVVDVGAERTCATVHRDGVLRGLRCIGAGAAHVTRDLAFALQVGEDAAEDLKRRQGLAWRDPAADGNGSLSHADGDAEDFASVIEPRMRELLQLVHDGLQQDRALLPTDRVVLTGGGARLRGTADLAHAVFGLPCRPAADPAEDSTWKSHGSQTMRGLLAYAAHRGIPCPAPRWSSAVRRLRGALVSGESAARLRDASQNSGVEVARHGERGTARVGVDSEVHDVRVRTRV